MTDFVVQETNKHIEAVDYSTAEISLETNITAWHLAQYLKRDIDKICTSESEEERKMMLLAASIDVLLTAISQLGITFTVNDARFALEAAASEMCKGRT